jgi:peptidoglycan/xylan/chitin deacetylase (PgdA/CDA1 family)
MSPEQIKGLAGQGMGIGGHTHRHPILTRLSESEARAEIEVNRDVLTDWLGPAPQVFAYPNGLPERDYGLREVGLVRAAGYRGAVTTGTGTGPRGTDIFQLPRFTPWSRGMIGFGARSLKNLWRAPQQLGAAA